ncbi:MAG: Ig-like domain-containing protein [Bacilli bacterium]|nr:Ig-like domain-containing protein [Bacilli bacterium]
MKKIITILPLLFAPVLSSCVLNNGVPKKEDFTISGVSFDVQSLVLKVGNEPKEFIPTINGEGEFNDSLKVSVKDETIATLSKKDGKSGEKFAVTPVKIGETDITVTPLGDESKAADLHVVVNEQGIVVVVESVSLDVETLDLTVGDSYIFIAAVYPNNATNQLVRYESSEPSVVSVDDNGNACALKEGTAVIKVTTVDGGKTASCTVNVSPKKDLVIGNYYLYGTPNEWKANASYELTKNESPYTDKEYMIKFEAKANEEFKVAQYNGEDSSLTNWYSVSASNSGAGENALTYVEFQSGGDLNMKIVKDGRFILYFDLNPQGDGMYKYWIELQLN